MPKLTDKITRTFAYDDDSTITIRYLKPGEQEEIDSAGMDMRGRQASANSEDLLTEVSFNFGERRKKFLVAVIESWTGFDGLSGKPAKCTPPNIIKFYQELGEKFYEKVEKEHVALTEEVEAEMEDAEKN